MSARTELVTAEARIDELRSSNAALLDERERLAETAAQRSLEVERAHARERELQEDRDELRRRVDELELERAGWAPMLRREVIVNTRDGAAFRGHVFGVEPWVLKGTTLLGEDGSALPSPLPIDGEVIIDPNRVAWVQAPPS